jgi:hypothetical protein
VTAARAMLCFFMMLSFLLTDLSVPFCMVTRRLWPLVPQTKPAFVPSSPCSLLDKAVIRVPTGIFG